MGHSQDQNDCVTGNVNTRQRYRLSVCLAEILLFTGGVLMLMELPTAKKLFCCYLKFLNDDARANFTQKFTIFKNQSVIFDKFLRVS